MNFPPMFRVRQSFDDTRVADVAAEVDAQLSRLQLGERVAGGASVAVTVGSRGIANIAEITKAAVGHIRSLGGEPFIVPAMGSHGGGTPEGQRQVIEGYGVTEEFCGCPIRSSMETVVVCQADEGFDVHFDRNAFEADHVLVVGRVKPHTDFVGDIQSGLMKMLLIGLGKHEGAKIYHRAIQDYSFGQILRSVASQVLARCNILAGLAIVENGYEQTALLEAVPPGLFETREKELLKRAAQMLPSLPFDEADILVVDQIGKNISGSGMDTNIVGRKFNDHSATGDERPRVRRIIVRGLTPETHGNATGIGMSEFCLSRVVETMDYQSTMVNCVTSGHVTAGMIPIHYQSDQETLAAALGTIGLTAPEEAKILRIKTTLDIAEFECSAAYLPEAKQREGLEILTEPAAWKFDGAGMLADFSSNGAH